MAWKIPEAEIEAVKRSADFVALVQSRGIALARHGTKDWRGLCPFHPDKGTPNFIVTPGKALFHCMTCGAAGNVIQFVQRHDGVSFTHAFELLKNGGTAAFAARPKLAQATTPALPCPLDAEADDATLCGQVAAYYRERLKSSPAARAYLKSRGLDDDALIDRFQLGFADRTLGLRLPEKNRVDGAKLRTRLASLGLYRESGHEHFNGCIVVPLFDAAGKIVSFYGRRVQTGEVRHLYPPGPHRGVFNPAAFDAAEIILCEAVLDALTFCAHGFAHTSCIYGTQGMTDEIWERLRKARKVFLAYDADDAGDRAAERDTARLKSLGVDVARVRFPWGLDANAYALKVQPAAKSLGLLLQAAAVDAPSVRRPAAAVSPAIARASSSLAAFVSRSEPEAAKEKNPAASIPAQVNAAPVNTTAAVNPPPSPTLEQRGAHHFLDLDGREYRLSGLDKAANVEALKTTLRVKVGERYHQDALDLCRDGERRRFAERAAEETGLTPELVKRDLGRVLLAAEQAVETRQATEAIKAAQGAARGPELGAAERAGALAWLTAPDLVARLRAAIAAAGIVGEDSNALVAFFAGVSRLSERPLAIVVQSPSAAGKSTLMDAVLAFFPEESRVKYSALTGQALYYLGETNLKHKILAIVEEAGAEKASYALKLLQSEGELVIASTGKDPHTGRMVTQEYRVEGPVMIFLTTTAIDLDEELQNRCLTLVVDVSAAQTARIHTLQRERRTLAGLVAREERKELLRVLKNAQRLLRPIQVVNDYAPKLTFPAERTRARRDHEKYLTLIDAIALLHQHQRPIKSHIVAGRAVDYIEATPADIALANELAGAVLARSLDELPPQTRALWQHVRALAQEKKGAAFTRRELCLASGWSLTQASLHLDRLVAQEYLAVRCGRMGSLFVYDLLVTDEQPFAVPLIGVEKLQLRPNLTGSEGHLTGGAGAGPLGEKVA